MSTDQKEQPAIDFCYCMDPDDYDKASFTWSLKAARKIAREKPLNKCIKREVAPGSAVQSGKDLSEYGCKVGNTVYHPCGTAKMGDVVRDPMAVVDQELRVKELKKLRVADASVIPLIPSVYLILTILAVGERAAELIIIDTMRASARL